MLTDLKEEDNILMALNDQSILNNVAQDETIAPLPQKHVDIDGKRTIYLSRNAFGSTQEIGIPVITDLGLAVRGDEQKYRYYPIQQDLYSAPEVVLKAGWSYSADIWNLGVLVSLVLSFLI